jgi:hypothetical protein
MLCELCSNIDFEQLMAKKSVRHHVSCCELAKSAERGCELCGRVWDGRLRNTRLTPKEHDGHGNTQLLIEVPANLFTPGGFETLRFFSDSEAFISFQTLCADDCKFMCLSTGLTILTNDSFVCGEE